MEKKKLVVAILINQPVELIWEFWTLPKHIVHWNFASDDWQCPYVENELCVGGKYKARMEAKDGSFGFDLEAIYDEVIPKQKIAFTMLDNRQAITTFEVLGKQTQVTIIFEAEQEYSDVEQEQGWLAILQNFKMYVEQYH